jgi:Big-like domain-containing protein
MVRACRCIPQKAPLDGRRRLRKFAAAVFDAAAMLALGGCASPGLPPGGPERHTPPMITRIQPDTNSLGVRGKEFVIHFDEVVSEHPANATTLNDLVLISPRNGAPRVDWHRSSLSIRPSKGWRANTAYTVTILPGISDLRGNIRTTPTVVTFSTGTSIPRTAMAGTMFDWLSGMPVNTGMIEARPVSDTSTVYLTASDSIGHYRIVGLPPTQYLVRGYADPNRNRALDPGEAFDTTRVYLADTLNLELLTFAHDSLGPKLGVVSPVDSVTIRAVFDTPVDPRRPITPAQFALTAQDSTRITILSVAPARPDTSHAPSLLSAGVAPVSQSAVPVPQRPVVAPVVLPKPTRPLLVRDLLIVIRTPLRAGATYRLDAINATGPTGKALSSSQSFTVPKVAPKAPPAAGTAPKPAVPNPRPAPHAQ